MNTVPTSLSLSFVGVGDVPAWQCQLLLVTIFNVLSGAYRAGVFSHYRCVNRGSGVGRFFHVVIFGACGKQQCC